MTQHTRRRGRRGDRTRPRAATGRRAGPPGAEPRLAGVIVAGFTALAVGVSVLGGDLLNPPASTTDGDYVDETVELMIPLAEGGGTDTWARFVAAELTGAVPGAPGLARRTTTVARGSSAPTTSCPPQSPTAPRCS